MLITKHTGITIAASAEKIWDFAHNPKNWTASNPEEHRGLTFFNRSNRPKTGVEFYQKEYVAGLYADLRGLVIYADEPHALAWTGVARYKLFGGLLRTRLSEGGLVTIQQTGKQSTLTHDVFMIFPETLFGKIMLWYFKHVLHGEEALYNHTYKELVFFKNQLEKAT